MPPGSLDAGERIAGTGCGSSRLPPGRVQVKHIESTTAEVGCSKRSDLNKPMRMSSRDANCRYIPLFDRHTGFDKLLNDLGIALPSGAGIETMVHRGWIKPVLRVFLPRTAIESWTNYPQFPMELSNCPEAESWALDLLVRARTSGWPRESGRWWVHELDDESDPLTQVARRHLSSPGGVSSELLVFRHARLDREVRPWLDYFAYWQAFQVADYARAMSRRCCLVEDIPVDRETALLARARLVDCEHKRLTAAWDERYAVFEWLSRMRTVVGSAVMPQREFEETRAAICQVAREAELSVDKMKEGIRRTLLLMWEEWSRAQETPALLGLLRQEIEYSIYFLERVSGERVDALDDYWSPHQRRDFSASLIDALPREEDLARRDFPRNVCIYLKEYRATVPQLAHLDETAIRTHLNAGWFASRAFRRFVLAFHRLHEQLRGPQSTPDEKVIRQSERIEQFNLISMHAERVLSRAARARTGQKSYSDVRALARESLNYVLGRWGLMGGDVGAACQRRMKELLVQRAQLHDLEEQTGLRLVAASEVASGNDVANELVAGFVNWVIARNYAAHHDVLDFDLVYSRRDANAPHPGSVALKAVLLSLLSVLVATPVG
ncbi:hypothetical protein PHYC_02319 [Phycisphaerales bacterium]|nr:hypothetical protein PHYC_02319 [Phycisphaerales bacterium]